MLSFRNRFHLGATALTGALAVGAFLGCGSSNNDQGTSFLATGYFTDSTAATGQSGTIAPLSTDVSGLSVALPSGVTLAADGLVVTTAMQFQNRLGAQFIRLNRIDCDYEVPGASMSIPSDSFAAGGVMGPDANASVGLPGTGTDGDTTTEPSAPGSQLTAEFAIVTPELYGYLNVNRQSLPELPFRLIATCQGVGITQAGDVLTTNPLSFTVMFVEVAECCGGADSEDAGSGGGFQEGTGTGGDFDSFDETDTVGGGTTSGT